VWVDNAEYSTPLRIDLTQSRVYLREGVERGLSTEPEDYPEEWLNISGKWWSIYGSGLVDKYKQPMYTVTDKPTAYFTYVFKFDVSTEQMAYLRRDAVLPGLVLASISDNWEIYMNGYLISRELHLNDAGEIVRHKNLHNYSVPFDKNYMSEGENTLVIHIATVPNYEDSGLYFNGDYYIDNYNSIRSEQADFFMLFLVGISFFMAFYTLMIYVNNKSERYYLYFAAADLLLAVYIFMNTAMVNYLFEDSHVNQVIEFITLTIMPIFAMLFTSAIAGRRVIVFMKVVTAIQIIDAVLMPFVGLQCSIELLYLGQVSVVFSLFYAIFVSVKWLHAQAKLKAQSGGVRFRHYTQTVFGTVMGNTLIGLILVLFSAVYGVILSMLFKTDQNAIILGLFSFVLSVSFALQNEVNETKAYIKNENVLLEDMVAKRTADLREQREIAVNASNTKSRFLATMSHEIRTPMNAIIGMSEIELQYDDLQDHTKDSLERIYNSGQNLLGIINDILDLSRAETGKLEIIPAEYNFIDTISDTVQLNIIRIGSKPIVFSLSLEDGLPKRLVGDELRIKQILNNILSNAFKYTEKGSVVFDIKQLKNDKKTDIVFTVADTGQGMKEEELRTLFDEYSRFNKIANRKTEGTGLGMNITGRLVDLMNGVISVESEFGKGSVFTVTIPQENPDIAAVITDEEKALLCSFSYHSEVKTHAKIEFVYMPYGRVLVVDDVETNRIVAEGLLKPYGVVVELADSGKAAIEKIANGATYDIVFMDHMMPEMDGIEATAILRKSGYDKPIIALTANAVSGQRQMFLQNGFDEFISKPIDIASLDRILQIYIHDRHPEEAAACAKPAISESPAANAAKKIPQKMIDAFLRDAQKALTAMKHLLTQNDMKNFAVYVHGMKSGLLSIGEHECSAAAKALELAAKAGDTQTVQANAAAFFGKLEDIVANLKPDITPSEPETDFANKSAYISLITSAAAACESYDNIESKQSIEQILRLSLPPEVKTIIEKADLLIFHADFEEAAELLTDLLKKLK
jgi:signal transduction histidine kinase/DNA-binding response OmpR family regulator